MNIKKTICTETTSDLKSEIARRKISEFVDSDVKRKTQKSNKYL